MSDQINDFDQLFRDRLSGQTATPPPAVWENIQSTRSFGHVVANRVSTNWRIFGTLLMLLLAGGSSVVLFGEEEAKRYTYQTILQHESETKNIEKENNTKDVLETKGTTIKLENAALLQGFAKQLSSASTKGRTQDEQEVFSYESFPSPELLASLELAGFVRPILSNERLSAYIENLEGWESARPKTFTRYYTMNTMNVLGVNKRELSANPKQVKIDYDYVMPRVEKKLFRERVSVVLAFTPHTIHKRMRADYNLSSSFLEDRKKAESTRLAYTASLLFQYELKNHKFIETGINHTQIYEEVSFEGKKRFSNQYNFVEIPVLLGYEGRNSKWGWHVKGGLGLQVHNTYEGYILKRVDQFGGTEEEPLYRMSTVKNFIDNDHRLSNNQARNEVVSLEEESENPYKTAGIVNLHLASGITYYHSIKTSFLVTPSYKRSVNSITKEGALFTEKLTYVGVSFGARVKF